MAIYGPDRIDFEGVVGDRFWFHDPFPLTGQPDVDDTLAGFPVAVFLPPHRPPQTTPLVIALQGMCAYYGLNAFVVPTLTQMGFAVALFDSPLGGERSLVRSFTTKVDQEVKPLVDRGIPLDSRLLLQIFRCVARDIASVRNFCRDRYHLTDERLVLFGVSLGVLQTSFAFTSQGIGDRLLGVIGHADLSTFAGSWGKPLLPELAVSWVGTAIEGLLAQLQPELRPIVPVLRLIHSLKTSDEFAQQCNPMTYVQQVNLPRRVRFLVGEADPLVRPADARRCAARFPDGECYAVPNLQHGLVTQGPSFVEHVRYFLGTQLSDWQA